MDTRIVRIRYDYPVLARSRAGAPVRLVHGTARDAFELRGVRRGSMDRIAPIPEDLFATPLHVHAGRLWQRIGLLRDGLMYDHGTGLDDALAALDGRGGGFHRRMHGLWGTPLYPYIPDEPRAAPEAGRDEALRPAARSAMAAFAGRDLVHDGGHLYMAVDRPQVCFMTRSARTAHLRLPQPYSHDFGPLGGVSRMEPFVRTMRAAGANPAAGMRIARELAGILPGMRDAPGAELARFANSAPGYAWAMLRSVVRARPAAEAAAPLRGLGARLEAIRPLAALGSVGAVPASELVTAVELAVPFVRALYAAFPKGVYALSMRAFLAHHDNSIRPLLPTSIPGEDAIALDGLVPGGPR